MGQGCSFFEDVKFKFNYIDLEPTIEKTLLDVEDFKLEYHISNKNFKYVEKNIIFHNLFTNILEIVKYYNQLNGFKPVLYTVENYIKRKPEVLIKQLKVLKKVLPVPFFVFKGNITDDAYGKLKEMNMKSMNFYSNKRVKLKDIKKYLNDNGYSTLANTMSSIVNLKGFYY